MAPRAARHMEFRGRYAPGRRCSACLAPFLCASSLPAPCRLLRRQRKPQRKERSSIERCDGEKSSGLLQTCKANLPPASNSSPECAARWPGQFVAGEIALDSEEYCTPALFARPEMLFGAPAQAFGGALRRDIALRHAQHFEADHVFAYCGGAQQRRIEVGMEMPLGVVGSIERRLMEAHSVREAGLEEIVVARGHAFKRVGKRVALVRSELRQRRAVSAADDECFKRPNRPPGNKRDEVIVFEDDAALPGALLAQVFAKQTAAGAIEIITLAGGLGGRLIGNVVCGPDLAVRMRVAGAHQDAAVFEDLDVADPIERGDLVVF